MMMITIIIMSCLLYYRAKQQNEVPPHPIHPTLSEHFYRHIFNTEFNLGFGMPRSDTCTRCELAIGIDAAHDPEKDNFEREQSDLQVKAQAGYTMKTEGKQAAKERWSGTKRRLGSHHPFSSKDSVDMITYDFQQNLPTPNLHHSEVFYMRQFADVQLQDP